MRKRILCVGESLVDVLPDGAERPGGAPANAAFHAVSSSVVDTALVSRLGDDALGSRLRGQLIRAGTEDNLLQSDNVQPTGTVRVRLRNGDPVYDIVAPAAWDFIEESAAAVAAARSSAVVIFGTLAQRHPVSRRTIRSLVVQARTSGATVVADLNLRPPFFDDEVVMWTLRHSDVLKLNCEELSTVSALLGAEGDMMLLFEGLLREFSLRQAVLTCGPDGAWFFDRGNLWHQPALPATVADTVGAGDAFTAVLAAALANHVPLERVAPLAAEVAAYVASQPGAVPAWPQALVEQAGRVLRGDG